MCAFKRFSTLITASVLLVGCESTPHRDVMLFGTQTKFGIDIARDPQATTPEFTLGYKRQEFVYLPLLANGADTEICSAGSACAPRTALYAGSRANPSGLNDTDAYSVFASFGATFGGGPSATEGGLAQFFATGLAAQALGQNTSIGRALSVQPTSSQVADTATQAAHALADALSSKERRAIASAAQAKLEGRAAQVTAIVAMHRTDGQFDASKWNATIDKLDDNPWIAEKGILKSLSTEDQIAVELELAHPELVPVLFELLTKKG